MITKMKIGYPCVNLSIGCKANKKFKLSSLNTDKVIETVTHNLRCLKKTLLFNAENGLFFFRLSSDTIPFASHKDFHFNWQEYFKDDFKEIEGIIKSHNMRISAHPGQFTVLNSSNKKVVDSALRELKYHVDFFKSLSLDEKAKIQIHIGGIYGDKRASIDRFIGNYRELPHEIKRHLVIENDDMSYSLRDCLEINEKTGIPVVFDVFHHSILNNGESIKEALEMASTTWRENDGPMMVDYSSQDRGKKIGTHCEEIDINDFQVFLGVLLEAGIDCDIMLEIRNKEKSALIAAAFLKNTLGMV